MTGTVTLYDKHGTFLGSKKFDHRLKLYQTLRDWSKLYGQNYQTFYYQISPDLKPETALKKAS